MDDDERTQHDADLAAFYESQQQLVEESANVVQMPIATALAGMASLGGGWGEMEALAAEPEPEPYPVDALPTQTRAAVIEGQKHVQAPFALVAHSAIGASALAVQGTIDVRRTPTLTGPTNLSLLSVALSGERKSRCDRLFIVAVEDFTRQWLTEHREDLKKNATQLQIWKQMVAGCEAAIKAAAASQKPVDKTTKPVDDHQPVVNKLQLACESLEKLNNEKPKEILIPKYKLSDETIENLLHKVATEWPSGAIVSSEGATVLGGHSMQSEKAAHNMGMLNLLWDGAMVEVGRRHSDDFIVDGARLSLLLQLQPDALRDFITKGDGAARGLGFLARFLMCYPASTQGDRPLNEDLPSYTPDIDAFNERTQELLSEQAEAISVLREGQPLTPPIVGFSADAQKLWVAHYNAIESEVGKRGKFADINDVASKAADNTARLSAVFHKRECGNDPDKDAEICSDCMQSAITISNYHLSEALRYYAGAVPSPKTLSAIKLEEWLLKECGKTGADQVRRLSALQYGPNRLRSRDKLDAAISTLEKMQRCRVVESQGMKFIQINPQLLDG